MNGLFAGIIATQMQMQTNIKRSIIENPVVVVEEYEPAIKLKRVTCYLDRGTTASGTETRYGVAAGKKEWLGQTIHLYENNDGAVGDYIDSFVIEDTGYGREDIDGLGTIQTGKTIDIWLPDEESVTQWQRNYGDYLFIMFDAQK